MCSALDRRVIVNSAQDRQRYFVVPIRRFHPSIHPSLLFSLRWWCAVCVVVVQLIDIPLPLTRHTTVNKAEREKQQNKKKRKRKKGNSNNNIIRSVALCVFKSSVLDGKEKKRESSSSVVSHIDRKRVKVHMPPQVSSSFVRSFFFFFFFCWRHGWMDELPSFFPSALDSKRLVIIKKTFYAWWSYQDAKLNCSQNINQNPVGMNKK